ncbi:hypothetical protein B0E46_15835 [Rhodanobacter sp. B04]|uniref:hypothetical protein n=1 Tax=Rhodanobacter sp. B04 TaxID=1945860 RepID=UPI00098467F7|nr:hypothetical protein [Rhodanobacter sp. B04]OOG61446.1 hypothetical protein B0E46_15835 [Rhodanobacter sp. B04]
MTTTAATLRALAVTALTGTTDAAANVFSILDWPTWSGSYPVLYLQTPKEEKESLGPNGAPQFTVTATIRIQARVQTQALANGAGAANALVALENIQRQIEVALINYTPLMVLLEQFPFVSVEKKVSGEGDQNLGELEMDVGMQFYQGPEDFYVVPSNALEQITVDADLVNVFDPNGTYANPPFPSSVEPAPRTSGPDGRAEAGADITLPQ